MSAAELKKLVKSKFKVNQTITLVVTEDDRKVNSRLTVKIVKFYPSFVLIERNGFFEGYTYWDILQMTSCHKPKEIIIPERYRKRKKVG